MDDYISTDPNFGTNEQSDYVSTDPNFGVAVAEPPKSGKGIQPTDYVMPGSMAEEFGAAAQPEQVKLTGSEESLIPIPRIEQQAGVLPQLGAAAVNTATGAINFATSPVGINTLPAAIVNPVAGKIAAGGFGVPMVIGGAKQAFQAPTLQGKAEGLLQALLGGSGVVHATGLKARLFPSKAKEAAASEVPPPIPPPEPIETAKAANEPATAPAAETTAAPEGGAVLGERNGAPAPAPESGVVAQPESAGANQEAPAAQPAVANGGKSNEGMAQKGVVGNAGDKLPVNDAGRGQPPEQNGAADTSGSVRERFNKYVAEYKPEVGENPQHSPNYAALEALRKIANDNGIEWDKVKDLAWDAARWSGGKFKDILNYPWLKESEYPKKPERSFSYYDTEPTPPTPEEIASRARGMFDAQYRAKFPGKRPNSKEANAKWEAVKGKAHDFAEEELTKFYEKSKAAYDAKQSARNAEYADKIQEWERLKEQVDYKNKFVRMLTQPEPSSPAVAEVQPVAAAAEAPQATLAKPTEGEPNAQPIESPTQPNGNVQQPEVTPESAGKVPANEGGAGVPASGQGQEVPLAEVTGDEPNVSAIANRFVKERASKGEVGEIEPGKGYATTDLIERGLRMSPEEVAQHVSDMMQGGGDPILQAAAIRGEEARLSQRSRDLSRAAEADPNNVEAKLAADNAFKDLTDFHNGPVARLKVNWANQGRAMQGEIPVDLSTFNGLREQWLRDTGKAPPPRVEAELRKTAKNVADAVEKENGARSRLAEAVDKETTRRGKLPTPEEVRDRLREELGLEPCRI